MLSWLRRRLHRDRIQPRIAVTADGFEILGSKGEWYPVSWAHMIKVATYKRDLVTTDEIMLAFELVDRPGVVQEISAEWDGFSDLFEPMEKHLGISPLWYLDVMNPAFAPNFRVLYERRPTGERTT